jgi:methionyl-tRNA formyltransferase
MRIVFMGTPQAAVPTLRRLVDDGHEIVAVWTQPDKPAGRGHKMTPSEVKEFALSRGLHIEQPQRIKTEEAKQLFASYDADVAVVVAYGRILPVEYLTSPRRGAINVHFSLLPKYRGAAPVNWAIANGEVATGVTTMFMEPELDSGPILLQRETTLGEKETAPELMSRLAEIGADLLAETLSQLDHLTPKPQRHDEASLAPILRKEDGLIDWTRDATSIERAVRAFQPWPNAYTTSAGRRLVVWKAEAVDGNDGDAGTVLSAKGDSLIIGCGGDTALRLLEVQPEAKRRMSARDFLNGTHLQIGDRFGQV